jgi:O-antigen/teichoic acid export membrane protein
MVGVGLMRLRQLRPDAWRGRDPTRDDPAWRRERFRRGAWVSVSQVAHLLLAGVDLILIGALLGPAAVVTYSVTAKLATVLANQPQLLLQVAEPGLSELRTAGQPADVHRAAGALREVVLLGSAALACVVVGVNEAFVTWWVGGEPFGGTVLTILVVLRFLVGHWTLTLSTLLLAAGYERFLAMVGLGQGALAVLLMILLLPVVGIVAVPVAGTAAILLTGLPANLVALVRVTGVGIASQVAAMWPIAWRVALGLSLAVGVGQLGVRPTASWLALATLATALPFLVLSIGRLRQQPTTRYLHPRVREWLR